ncbi:hypothetical protein Tco_0219656, partial [Tanacetum coccineum]
KSEYGLLEVRFLVGQNLVSRSVPHDVPDVSYEKFLQSQIPEVGRKKSWRSNSGNTGNEGKTVGGAIGACCRGIVEAKRYLDKSSEGSGEVFPGEAGE